VGPGAGLDGCGKSHTPPPQGLGPRTVQLVASCYTDCAIITKPFYVLRSFACLGLPCFMEFCRRRQNFLKKYIGPTICILNNLYNIYLTLFLFHE